MLFVQPIRCEQLVFRYTIIDRATYLPLNRRPHLFNSNIIVSISVFLHLFFFSSFFNSYTITLFPPALTNSLSTSSNSTFPLKSACLSASTSLHLLSLLTVVTHRYGSASSSHLIPQCYIVGYSVSGCVCGQEDGVLILQDAASNPESALCHT